MPIHNDRDFDRNGSSSEPLSEFIVDGVYYAPLPPDEEARLMALHSYNILDTLPDTAIDDLNRITAQICGTPIALVSLVDRDRLWFKSKVGYEDSEAPRNTSFCTHAVLTPDELLVIPDATKDPRFANNPLVTQPNGIRFYAGTPLLSKQGYALGALCAIDTQPRQLSSAQLDSLAALGRQVMDQLEARVNLTRLEDTVEKLHRAQVDAVQAAKMSALGHLVSGVAHEINNPIGFIGSNLPHIHGYAQDLLEAVEVYEQSERTDDPDAIERLEELGSVIK